MKNETKYKSLEEMSRKKRNALAIAEEEFHFVDGLKDFLTQIYTSSGHFVYELLQNAEDENAKEVIFELFEDRLVVSHDGDKLFDLIDIDSITDAFDSAKTLSKFKEGNPIGKYGVGFKSVFEYTQEPEILSGKYHFKIEKMFVPQKIDDDFYEKTKFILPLGTDKKTTGTCKREIEKALFDKLQFDTLLFLKNINTVKCIYKNKIITLKRNDNVSDYFNNLCTITYDNDTELKEYAFLRFFKEINIKTSDDEVEKKTEIAIAYQIEQSYFANNEINLKPILIDNVPKGKVYTFFPCEREVSNLCFHIHAQFALQPTRESFRDDDGNKKIMSEIGNLVCDSIKVLKEKKLLDENLLCVLPNRNDFIDDKYSIIRIKVFDLFNYQPFVPMKNDTFKPAEGKFIGKKDFQEFLFPEEEMKILFNSDKNSYWIKVPFWKGRDRAFIYSLQIEEFSIETFINKIKDYFYNNSSYYKKIINHYENKNIEWFKKLYIELNNTSEYYLLKPLSLCLCEDGKLHNALNCYRKQKNFDVSSFRDDKVFIDPRIFIDEDRKTVISIKHFFDNLDIKEFGKKEYQTKFLEDYEKKDVSLKKVEDIITFYEWYIKDKDDYNFTDIISILKEQQFLLKSKDGEWESARYLYFPEEFNYSISNISIYYEDFYNRNFIGVGFTKNDEYKRYKNLLEIRNDKIKQMSGLSIEYLQILNDNPNIDKNNFLNFLKELGVKDCVDVFKTDCNKNDYHIDIERSITTEQKNKNKFIDEDYDIPFLSSMLEISNNDIFNFVWSLLKKIRCKDYAFCKYGNKKQLSNIHHSQLVNVLRKSLWVKQVNKGETYFAKPQDATRYSLPNNLDNELDFDENLSNWIKILDFGENIRNNNKDVRDLSERIGIPETQINILKEMNNLPESERKEAEDKFAEFKTFVISRKYKNLNEDSENINIGHIKEKAVESIKNASNITRSLKETTRRDHYSDTKKLAKPYLVSKYTNKELQQIICQICGQPMPFKCKDGSDYFETTQIFTENLMPAEGVYENYMALCPVCGARYKEYIFHSEEKQKKLLNDIINSKDEDTIFKLDLDKEFQVNFEKAHIITLRTKLKILQQEDKNKKDNDFISDIEMFRQIAEGMKKRRENNKE